MLNEILYFCGMAVFFCLSSGISVLLTWTSLNLTPKLEFTLLEQIRVILEGKTLQFPCQLNDFCEVLVVWL